MVLDLFMHINVVYVKMLYSTHTILLHSKHTCTHTSPVMVHVSLWCGIDLCRGLRVVDKNRPPQEKSISCGVCLLRGGGGGDQQGENFIYE